VIGNIYENPELLKWSYGYRPKTLPAQLSQGRSRGDPAVSAKPRKCRMCPSILPRYIKYYCSGMCIAAARLDGAYGHEEE
jgi:hypothetical protein